MTMSKGENEEGRGPQRRKNGEGRRELGEQINGKSREGRGRDKGERKQKGTGTREK